MAQVRLTRKKNTIMKHFKTIALALFASILVSSCVVVPGKLSQHKTEVEELNTKTSMKKFTGVYVAGSMKVMLSQGDSSSVTIKGDNKEALDKLVIYVKNDNLNIEVKKKFMGFEGSNNFDDITIHVTAPTIKSIELAGSGSITTQTPISASNVDVQMAGSGTINIAKVLSCTMLEVEMAGSGNVLFSQVSANVVNTSVAGSGDVAFNNMDVVNVNSSIAGSGNIILKGKAARHTQNVAGSGNVDDSGLTMMNQ